MKVTFTLKLIYCTLLFSITYTSCVSDTNSEKESENITQISEKQPIATGTSSDQANLANEQKSIETKNSSETASSISSISESAPKQLSTTKAQEKKDEIKSNETKVKMKPKPTGAIPDACTLINEPFIGKTISVNSDAITIKDGSISATSTARSCFFRWEHKGVPNSGVLIQIQENPLPEEISDWAAYFIQAKINSGDSDPTSGVNYKYKPVDGIGVKGAYNYDMHRYFFRTEDDKVFMVAFNIRATEQEELSWAKDIGKEVLKNYNNL